jgi:hypothetical protein
MLRSAAQRCAYSRSDYPLRSPISLAEAVHAANGLITR